MELGSGMRAVVIGLGRSGLAVVRFLHSCGLEVLVSEAGPEEAVSRENREMLDRSTIGMEYGGHTEEFVCRADLVVVSPGVDPGLDVLDSARRRGIPVVGELELAAGRIEVPVIAVTGSNGKTTVTSLIAALLEADGYGVFLGGNIGTPLCEYLLAPGRTRVVVLELSSFQLETVRSFRPDIGLFLNLSPDHLDRHGSMTSYLAAKRRIFASQGAGDWAILGRDDPVLAGLEIGTGATTLWFGRDRQCSARVAQEKVVLDLPGILPGREEYDLAGTSLASGVNRLNSAAAILAARVFGCSEQAIQQGLAGFEPPEHRMTRVAVIDGVEFVDDSKATNIGAVQAALSAYDRPVILIAGGRNKGGDFRQLRPHVSRHVRRLVLLGESAGELQAALGDLVPWQRVNSMEAAVRQAARVAEPGDVVLLAPGCASFDMFASYSERGRIFAAQVRELAARGRFPGQSGCRDRAMPRAEDRPVTTAVGGDGCVS